jgi:monofunctional biosynthetic peptidoglycan transglycosylase
MNGNSTRPDPGELPRTAPAAPGDTLSGNIRDANMCKRILRGCWITVFILCLAAVGRAAETFVEEKAIVSFETPDDSWPSIDDVVMGGRSNSSMTVEEGRAVFRGVVSLANNGGFASVRSRPQALDLSAYDGLVLRVKGDGKRYGFRLRTTDRWDGVSYQAELTPAAGEWQEIVLEFEDFIPVFRGRVVRDHPPLDPARIRTLGLIIAGKQEGPFRLELEWIKGRSRPQSP